MIIAAAVLDGVTSTFCTSIGGMEKGGTSTNLVALATFGIARGPCRPVATFAVGDLAIVDISGVALARNLGAKSNVTEGGTCLATVFGSGFNITRA
jgi:hypothetical protein